MKRFALRRLGSWLAPAGVALAIGSAVASDPGTESPKTTPATNAPARTEAAPAVKAPPTKETKPESRARPEPSVSFLSQEIVKMTEAGVGTAVIRAYVERSRIAYPPRAEEVVYLHEHGIPADVVTALIQRASELRERAEEAARESAKLGAQRAPSAPPAAPVQQPVYEYPPQAAYVYTYTYPKVVYVNYPSWGWGWGWPSVWWSGGCYYRPGWRHSHWLPRHYFAPVRAYPRYGPWTAPGGHFGGRSGGRSGGHRR